MWNLRRNRGKKSLKSLKFDLFHEKYATFMQFLTKITIFTKKFKNIICRPTQGK